MEHGKGELKGKRDKEKIEIGNKRTKKQGEKNQEKLENMSKNDEEEKKRTQGPVKPGLL